MGLRDRLEHVDRRDLMATKKSYSVFGFQVSSDLTLPELAVSQRVEPSPVNIQAAEQSQWPLLEPSHHSTQTLQLGAGEWRLGLEGIGWFRASNGQTLEWQRWDDSVSDRDVRTFAVTSGLGAVAVQRGLLVLHGTAVERGGQAVLLLGHPATGKSTLAWCLVQRGWRLLSSELTVVDGMGMVWPGIQQLKLWNDAAERLGLDWTQLPPVRRGLKRYALLPQEVACAEQPLPLRSLYVLSRRKPQATSTDHADGQLRVSDPFSQQQALLSLRNQAFQARVYRGMGLEAGLFVQAGALARRMPLRALQVPDGITAMGNGLEGIDLLDPASLLSLKGEGSDG